MTKSKEESKGNSTIDANKDNEEKLSEIREKRLSKEKANRKDKGSLYLKLIVLMALVVFAIGGIYTYITQALKISHLTPICDELAGLPNFEGEYACYIQAVTMSDGTFEELYVERKILSKKEIVAQDIADTQSLYRMLFIIHGLKAQDLATLISVYEKYISLSKDDFEKRSRIIESANYLLSIYESVIRQNDSAKLSAVLDKTIGAFISTANADGSVPEYIESDVEALELLSNELVKLYGQVLDLEYEFEYAASKVSLSDALAAEKSLSLADRSSELKFKRQALQSRLIKIGYNRPILSIKLAKVLAPTVNLNYGKDSQEELEKYNFIRSVISKNIFSDPKSVNEMCPILISINKDEIEVSGNKFKKFSDSFQQSLKKCLDAYNKYNNVDAGYMLLSILADDTDLVFNIDGDKSLPNAVIVNEAYVEDTVHDMLNKTIDEFAPEKEYIAEQEHAKNFAQKLEVLAKGGSVDAVLDLARGYATGLIDVHFYGNPFNMTQDKTKVFVVSMHKDKALQYYNTLNNMNKFSLLTDKDIQLYSALLLENGHYQQAEQLLTKVIENQSSKLNRYSGEELVAYTNQINHHKLSLATAYCKPKDDIKNHQGEKVMQELLQSEHIETMQKMVVSYLNNNKWDYYNCHDIDVSAQVSLFYELPPSIEMFESALATKNYKVAIEIYNVFTDGVDCLGNGYDYDTVKLFVANRLLQVLIDDDSFIQDPKNSLLVHKFSDDLRKVTTEISLNIDRLSEPKVSNRYIDFVNIMSQELSMNFYYQAVLKDKTAKYLSLEEKREATPPVVANNSKNKGKNSRNQRKDKAVSQANKKNQVETVNEDLKQKSFMFNHIFILTQSLSPLTAEVESVRYFNVDTVRYLIDKFDAKTLNELSPKQIAKLYYALDTWYNYSSTQATLLKVRLGDDAYLASMKDAIASIVFPEEYTVIYKKVSVLLAENKEAVKFYKEELLPNDEIQILFTSNKLVNELVQRVLEFESCTYGSKVLCEKAKAKKCVPDGVEFPKIKIQN